MVAPGGARKVGSGSSAATGGAGDWVFPPGRGSGRRRIGSGRRCSTGCSRTSSAPAVWTCSPAAARWGWRPSPGARRTSPSWIARRLCSPPSRAISLSSARRTGPAAWPPTPCAGSTGRAVPADGRPDSVPGQRPVRTSGAAAGTSSFSTRLSTAGCSRRRCGASLRVMSCRASSDGGHTGLSGGTKRCAHDPRIVAKRSSPLSSRASDIGLPENGPKRPLRTLLPG